TVLDAATASTSARRPERTASRANARNADTPATGPSVWTPAHKPATAEKQTMAPAISPRCSGESITGRGSYHNSASFSHCQNHHDMTRNPRPVLPCWSTLYTWTGYPPRENRYAWSNGSTVT